MAETEKEGQPKRRVGYCGRMKKCASRTCWGLGLSVSAEEELPDPNNHEFPLFEGTHLTAAEKAKLRQEKIQFNESLPKLKDPGPGFGAQPRVSLGNGVFRSVGQAPAEGKDEDKKAGGEVRAKNSRRTKRRSVLYCIEAMV